MREFATIFLALIFETTPFLLGGVLISVFAGPLIERALSAAAFRVPAVGMVAGAGAGMLLPMCDCGTRPLAHRLALAGRKEFAVAFMVAAPVVNPVVVLTTWLAFRDPTLLALRLGITFVMALIVGLVVSALKADIALPTESSGHNHDHDEGRGFGTLANRSLDEFFELFRFLVIGSALAAAIQQYVDTSALSTTQGVYFSIAAMMLLAFLLSICSSVDAFVVAGLGAGLGMGPMLAFLVFGPVVNLKSAPLYFRLFSVPAVVLMALLVTQLAFISAAVVELRSW